MERKSTKLILELLIWCYVASAVGILTAIAYITGALTVTMDLVFDLALPAILISAADALGQYYADMKLLRAVREYYDRKEAGEDVSHLALAAQEEIRGFPLKGALVSLGLWLASAVFLPLWFTFIQSSPHFVGREKLGFFVSLSLGSFLAFIFQYFYYKRILRKQCADIIKEPTGFHEKQKTGFLNIQAKLMVTFVTLILVIQLFAAFISTYTTGEALRLGKENNLIGIAKALGASYDKEALLISFAQAARSEIFILDPQGELVSGKTPDKDTLNEISKLAKDFTDDIKQWTSYDPVGKDISLITSWWKLGYSGWVNHKFEEGEVFRHRIPYSNDEFGLVLIDDGRNYLCTVLKWSGYSSVIGKLSLLFWVIAVIAALLSYYLAWLASKDVTEPLEEMNRINKEISRGNLNQDIYLISEDESAELAASLQIMSRNLTEIIGKVGSASEQVKLSGDEISSAVEKVREGSSIQVKAVEDTLESTEEMNSSILSISDNVEMLATSAQESSRYIQDMGGLVDELADNIKDFSVAVESTSTAVLEMTASIRNTADNVEILHRTSEDTASSMLEMNASIKQVEENSLETKKLSDKVSELAKVGVEAVQNTIGGNAKIEESVRGAKDVISGLESKAREIGKIIKIIDEVTEKTNLLALNAAIIAAQAGKHGKGFSVVADQIKKLADKTATSTQDISELINAVQEGSALASERMEEGFQAVEDGVNLAFQAGQVLEQIEKSANTSSGMVKQIATATEEQAKTSKRVTEAVESIAQRIDQIALATREQSKGSELIIRATEEMRELSPMVKHKSERLAEGGRQVNMAMENINQMVSYINKSQKEQATNADQILAAVNQIKEIGHENASSVENLDGVVNSLNKQSDILKSQMDRFKL